MSSAPPAPSGPAASTEGSAGAPAASRPASSFAPAALIVFLAASVTRLVAIPLDRPDVSRYSTILLMSALAAWVLARRGPVLIAAGLMCSWAGDILLGQDGLFIVGMGAFAVAHVCYIGHFLRTGAAARLRRRWWLVLVYLAGLAALVAWLWGGLGDLRIPVLAYSVLLAGTAVMSGALNAWLGVGGALFFVSDSLIAAVDLAQKLAPPLPGMWIMVTYIAAQFLLASGAVARASGAVARAASQPIP